jgi:hypothetical protein
MHRKEKTICFGIGFGIAMLSLALCDAWYRSQFPLYFQPNPPASFRDMMEKSTPAVPTDSPRYTINAWGLREEHSASAHAKATNAVQEFVERVSRAGLRLRIEGQLKTRVLAGKGIIAFADTGQLHFGVHYSATEPAAVDVMQWKGEDAHGLPKDYNSVLSSGNPNTNYLAAWADSARYPLQSGPDDVKDEVIALLQELEVGGTNRYLLEKIIRLQMGVYRLPFYNYQFTTREFFGQDWNGNRDEISIVVRVGGTDLEKGTAELASFEDAGYLWRKLESAKPKPKPVPPGAKRL